MAKTSANIFKRSVQVNLCANFLLFVMLFFSTGFLPKYLYNIDDCKFEICDNIDCDKEKEKKEGKEEGEKDFYMNNLFISEFVVSKKQLRFTKDINRNYSFSLDILTPPPEQI